MGRIGQLLRQLIRRSPFLWEVKTDGVDYTILCEGTEVHDPESGIYLTDLTELDCEIWLEKLVKMS